jgi:hypothetical protein
MYIVEQAPTSGRFSILHEAKILYAADLVAAFSTDKRPWTTKMANKVIKRAGGFQFAPGGLWMCTRTQFKDAFPRLAQALLEHEVEQL